MRLFYTMKNYYNNLSIRKKLMLIFLLISVLPMCLIQMLNYAFSTNILNTHVNKMLDASLQQAHSEVEMRLKTYYNMISDLSNDKTMVESMSHINVWGTQFHLEQRQLRNELKKVAFDQNGLLGIGIVTKNGEMTYYDSISMSVIDSYCFDLHGIRQQPIIAEAQNNPKAIYTEARSVSKPGYETKNILYLSKSLSDYRNIGRTSIGTLVLCIDESVFAGAYQKPNEEELNLTFVVDQNGNIFSSNDATLLGGTFATKTNQVSDEEIKDYMEQLGYAKASELSVKTYTAPDSNYTMINIQRENYLLNQIYSRGAWIVFLAFGTILVTVAIINYTSNNIRSAVRRIIDSMKQANTGDLSVRIKNDGNDEFAQISQNFNVMIGEMQHLMTNEKNALERKRKAEIKALEAQINPHFLYNTLDSINWIAIQNEQFEISKALKYLAIILRYSIANSNSCVTLQEELEYLKKYIYLQQNRFRYSFLCLIHIPDELQNIRIHKLLMQPLIENSIEHAFPGKTGQDRIEIKIFVKEQGTLQISVSDNGVGMDDALIEELNHFDYESDNIKSNIGIRNVISRIKIYYGENGSFKILKNPDHGICIELTIPYEEEQEGLL